MFLYQLVPTIWSQLCSVLPTHGLHQIDQVPVFHKHLINIHSNVLTGTCQLLKGQCISTKLCNCKPVKLSLNVILQDL